MPAFIASTDGLLVPVVGRADDHRVNILARQNLVVVAGGEDVVAPEFLAVLQPAVVAVGHGHQLHAGNLHGGLGVALSLPARADQRDLDVIVGGTGCAGSPASAASAWILRPASLLPTPPPPPAENSCDSARAFQTPSSAQIFRRI